MAETVFTKILSGALPCHTPAGTTTCGFDALNTGCVTEPSGCSNNIRNGDPAWKW